MIKTADEDELSINLSLIVRASWGEGKSVQLLSQLLMNHPESKLGATLRKNEGLAKKRQEIVSQKLRNVFRNAQYEIDQIDLILAKNLTENYKMLLRLEDGETPDLGEIPPEKRDTLL